MDGEQMRVSALLSLPPEGKHNISEKEDVEIEEEAELEIGEGPNYASFAAASFSSSISAIASDTIDAPSPHTVRMNTLRLEAANKPVKQRRHVSGSKWSQVSLCNRSHPLLRESLSHGVQEAFKWNSLVQLEHSLSDNYIVGRICEKPAPLESQPVSISDLDCDMQTQTSVKKSGGKVVFSEETNEFEDYDQSTDENETIPNEVLFPNPELLPSWTSASTVREMRASKRDLAKSSYLVRSTRKVEPQTTHSMSESTVVSAMGEWIEEMTQEPASPLSSESSYGSFDQSDYGTRNV